MWPTALNELDTRSLVHQVQSSNQSARYYLDLQLKPITTLTSFQTLFKEAQLSKMKP